MLEQDDEVFAKDWGTHRTNNHGRDGLYFKRLNLDLVARGIARYQVHTIRVLTALSLATLYYCILTYKP